MPNQLIKQLREKAENILRDKYAEFNHEEYKDNISKLLEELSIYQIELELQNEELRNAQIIAEHEKQRFVDLFQNAPVGYFQLDINGKILDFNRKASELFATPSHILKQRPFIAFIEKEYISEFHTHLRKVFQLQTDTSLETEIAIKTATKEIRFLKIQSNLIFDTTGQKKICRTIAEDITEKIESQKKITGLSNRLNASMLVGNIAWWELELPSGDIQFNDNKAHMLGYSPEQFKHFTDFTVLIHPDDYEPTMAAFTKHLNGEKELYQCEYRIKTIHNQYIWFSDVGKITDRAEGYIKLVGIATDISKFKQTELSLRTSESKLKEAQQIAKLGNWELDIQNNILYWSDEIYELFEVDSSTFKATYQAFIDQIHPEDREMVSQAYYKSLETKEPYNLTHRLKLSDGTVKYVNEVCRTDFDSKGKPMRSIGIVIDVTEQKLTELSLHQKNFDLGERMKEIRCLYYISHLVTDLNLTEDEVFEKTISHLPQAFQWPENTCTKITFNKKTFQSPNYSESFWKLTADIVFQNKISGQIEIGITEQSSLILTDPFLKEERELIQGIVELLISFLNRKMAEREIRKLNTAITQSPASIAITDKSGKIEYVNPTFTKNTGYSQEEAIHHTPRILKSGYTKSDTYTQLWNTISSGNIWNGVFYNKRKDGTFYWEKAVISPILDEYNKITNYVAVKEDITDRINVENALKENEEKLKSIVNQFPNGSINLINKERKFVISGGSDFYKHGINPENYIGKSVKKILSPSAAKLALESIDKAFAGETHTYEIEFEGAIYRNISSPVNTESKEIENVMFICINITDQKLAEKSLKDSEEKFRQLFHFMPVGITVSDADGKILDSNQTSEQLLGISAQNQIGRTVDDSDWKIIHKDGRRMLPEEYASVRALNEKRLVKNVEMGIYKGPNDITWIDVTASPSIIEENQVIVAYIDISERIKQEQQINAYTNQLQELIATKDKLFSIIAHDLKNPFNTLLGFSDLLVRNAGNYDSEKIKQFASSMRNSAKSAYSLLENLLQWSRVQTGALVAVPEKINCPTLINEIIPLFAEGAKSKNLGFSIISDSLHEIKADSEMIKTILRNLISNAIKFSHSEAEITIKTVQIEKYIQFSITDQGIGIEKEHLEKLFKVDNKLSKIGTNNETGTGLGLLLCNEFIRKINGSIWVESDEGKGSSFIFNVPIFD